MEDNVIRVESSVSFGTLSWIVWVVFMILYYGTGTIAHWPVFWIWFPFWLPLAIGGLGLLLWLILFIIIKVTE